MEDRQGATIRRAYVGFTVLAARVTRLGPGRCVVVAPASPVVLAGIRATTHGAPVRSPVWAGHDGEPSWAAVGDVGPTKAGGRLRPVFSSLGCRRRGSGLAMVTSATVGAIAAAHRLLHSCRDLGAVVLAAINIATAISLVATMGSISTQEPIVVGSTARRRATQQADAISTSCEAMSGCAVFVGVGDTFQQVSTTSRRRPTRAIST